MHHPEMRAAAVEAGVQVSEEGVAADPAAMLAWMDSRGTATTIAAMISAATAEPAALRERRNTIILDAERSTPRPRPPGDVLAPAGAVRLRSSSRMGPELAAPSVGGGVTTPWDAGGPQGSVFEVDAAAARGDMAAVGGIVIVPVEDDLPPPPRRASGVAAASLAPARAALPSISATPGAAEGGAAGGAAGVRLTPDVGRRRLLSTQRSSVVSRNGGNAALDKFSDWYRENKCAPRVSRSLVWVARGARGGRGGRRLRCDLQSGHAPTCLARARCAGRCGRISCASRASPSRRS